MRCLICIFAVMFCDVTHAQDPTVPSAQILERLHHEQPTPVVRLPFTNPLVQEQLALPVLKLKALVLADSDHGTALIEVEGRRIRLRLVRPATDQLAAPLPATSQDLDGVVIQNSTYHVQSFSSRSILLSNDSHTLLVQ